MTDEKIFQRTIYPAYQWSPETIIKAFFCFLDCLNPHQKVRHFLAAGVPISSKCPRNQTKAADSGTKDGVYRETPNKFDPPSQATGQINRGIAEWSGDASLRGISQKTWLRNLIESFRRNMSLTGCFNESFHKSIAYWCPKEKIFIMRKNYV